MDIIWSIIISGLLGILNGRAGDSNSGSDGLRVRDDEEQYAYGEKHLISNEDKSYKMELSFSDDVPENVQEAFIEAANGLAKLVERSPVDFDDGIAQTRVSIHPSGNMFSTAYTYIDQWDSSNKIPVEAHIVYEESSISKADTDQLINLATHELLHSMGFGVSWDNFGLVEIQDDTEYFYVGYSNFEGNENEHIPLADDAMHWDEIEFGDEIGTPVVDEAAFIGSVTLNSLRDIGYLIKDEEAQVDNEDNEDNEDNDFDIFV